MNSILVEVTDDKYRILKHEPGGIEFNEDGRAMWPADQFTTRLLAEGSIRIVADTASPPPAQSGDQ